MGGLVFIFKDLLKDSFYWLFYEILFWEMAVKVVFCQEVSGFWYVSMLDYEVFFNLEISLSVFFCYVLAYGVCSGLLDWGQYELVVQKVWQVLVSVVYLDGKLGWVQLIGEDFRDVIVEMMEVYGVGAFLLVGIELL